MNYHIVRTNESIEDIALLYNLDLDEIKESNKHIRVWTNLTPGLKIRLPEIPESLAIEIDDVEPFIEDYYPKLSPLYKEEPKKETIEEIPVVNIQEQKINHSVPKNPIGKHFYYYPYPYNPYYEYYRYYHQRRKPK